MGIITFFAFLVQLYWPGDVIGKLWFFSLFANGGALFALLQARTLPELVLGWSAFFVGGLFIFLLLGPLPVALLFSLWFILGILFLLKNRKKFLNQNKNLFHFILFAANMGVYVQCLCLASLTKNMLEHAKAMCLLGFVCFCILWVSSHSAKSN